MAFDPNEYPEQYAIIKDVNQRAYTGDASELDRNQFYYAKETIFWAEFMKPTSNHRREKRNLNKYITAGRTHRAIHKALDPKKVPA
jgi:hypothetical protein